jgi:hypothetical protein
MQFVLEDSPESNVTAALWTTLWVLVGCRSGTRLRDYCLVHRLCRALTAREGGSAQIVLRFGTAALGGLKIAGHSLQPVSVHTQSCATPEPHSTNV